MDTSTGHDTIIVGGGPAGLTAALYAGRSKLDALLLERGAPGGQLLNTKDIEDYPGFRHVGGPELARKMTDHARDFGCPIEQARVTRVHQDPEADDPWNRWIVETESQGTYRSATVILGAGGAPNKLEVPGEEEYAGRGVSYCAVCDGAFFQDDVLAVVGGGDAACEEAVFLTRYARKVYLIHRRDEFRAAPLPSQEVLDHPDIEVVWDTVVQEIQGNPEDGVKQVILQGTRAEDGAYDFEGVGARDELAVDGVFIFIGFIPNVDLLDEHVEHDQGGHLVTNERMETSLSGLFAVGDVRSQVIRQITTAVGDGTVAAMSVEKKLGELKRQSE